jgi:ribosomal protein S12 methylthiotransferase
MPLQHISDRMLRAMRRGLTKKRTIELLEKIRTTVPGIVLRSTFIVGFPGETDKDFQELLDFLRDYRIERVGAFLYSHEEGTAAYQLKDDVPKRVKKARYDALMAQQQSISLAFNQSLIGKTLPILVDERAGDTVIGRTPYDALEVDNLVHVADPHKRLAVGEFHRVRVVDAAEYDLWAEAL